MVMEKWNVGSNDKSRCYLLCLTLDGIPLFTRTKGQLPSIPFPIIGSINGVYMFAHNNKVELSSTLTDNAKICWKEYQSIRLIIVNFDENRSEYHLHLLLDNIYNCMVVVVGANEFNKVNNVEKLKKKLKLCMPLVTTFLNETPLLSNITQATDVILCSELGLLQSYLNAFVVECQSEFGCLMLHGKVIVGTEKFWQLLPVETSLMMHFIASLPSTSASDIPMYLPNGSPTIPHRLITIKLLENINVVIVCGPQPSLQEVLNKYLRKYWLPLIETLRLCLRSYPRGFTPEIKVDANVLSFILVNVAEGKCLSSFYPQGNMTGADQIFLTDMDKRRTALVSFYQSVVGSLFTDNDENGNVHHVLETYKCTDHYKCYAIKTSTHQIFTLFSNDISTYTLGSITKQLVRQMTRENCI